MGYGYLMSLLDTDIKKWNWWCAELGILSYCYFISERVSLV